MQQTRILFVCTGNTCRSPLAAAIAKSVFKSAGIPAEVSSAGISAYEFGGYSENSVKTAKAMGLTCEGTPRQVRPEDINNYDIILTMTNSHKAFLSRLFQDSQGKVFTIYEYAENSSGDVADPFGLNLNAYMECGKELRALIEKIPERLKKDVKAVFAIGCDHGGYQLKQEILTYLDKNNIAYKDFGTDSEQACDYPEFAKKVCAAVLEGQCRFGLLICGTGIGISIAANRHKGIRAALCHDVFSAKATRLHNDANVLAMGGRVIGAGLALEIVQAFMSTDFSNETRHKNRISQIDQ